MWYWLGYNLHYHILNELDRVQIYSADIQRISLYVRHWILEIVFVFCFYLLKINSRIYTVYIFIWSNTESLEIEYNILIKLRINDQIL
jgi:hypothetical protein